LIFLILLGNVGNGDMCVNIARISAMYLV